MTQTIDEILSQATFYSDGQNYTLVRLPARAIIAAAGVVAEVAEPFCALIVDKDEVSLLIPSDAYNDFAGRLPGSETGAFQYRLITIDIPLDPLLTGFMARISAELARAGVPILPYAAFSRDHIVVPVDKFEIARETLEKLKASK